MLKEKPLGESVGHEPDLVVRLPTASARLHAHGPAVQLSKEGKKKWRAQEDVIRILFEDIAPAFKERSGGYTRIMRLEQRPGDSAQKAILEWVDEIAAAAPEPAPTEAKPEAK